MALLTCKNLSLGYSSVPVVQNLSFCVNSGDYLCIVGENGSGKSTLLKAVLRLHAPLAGEIVTGDGLLPNRIGYLPQQNDVQRDFPASVREIVLSGFLNRTRFRPFYTKAERAAAQLNMQKMGIESLSLSCYRELSGGQQQRVLLSRALCAAEKMLILDEPVANLDPKAAAELYALIDELHQNGMCIVMISHDIEEACKRATHILHIGKTCFFGTAQEYAARFLPCTARQTTAPSGSVALSVSARDAVSDSSAAASVSSANGESAHKEEA